jgi:hypothetical protein
MPDEKSAMPDHEIPDQPSGTATYEGTNQTISSPQIIARVTSIPAILFNVGGSSSRILNSLVRQGAQRINMGAPAEQSSRKLGRG